MITMNYWILVFFLICYASNATTQDNHNNDNNTASLILQNFGSITSTLPHHSNFTKTEYGTFTSSDGWFYRNYNDRGYIRWESTANNTTPQEEEKEEHYIRIQYEAEQSEDWGGFVDFGHMLLNRNNINANTTDNEDDLLGYSSPLYDCTGATHIKLGYRIETPQSVSARAHMRLILLDGSNCIDDSSNTTCTDNAGQSLENWYSFHYILGESTYDVESGEYTSSTTISSQWQELMIDWKSFERTGWHGQVGNDILDLNAIRGWRLEISIDSQGERNSSSIGVIDINELSCVGHPEIINSPFLYNGTISESNGVWSERHYQSSLSQNLTSAHIIQERSTIVVNYTVQQAEDWGGFLDFSHISPGFYDLSEADAISLDYRVIQPTSVEGRAHLRLILLDGSDCVNIDGDCDAYPGQMLENYYSFHYILDNVDEKEGTITVPLLGDSNTSSHFVRTGWTGVVGNDVLDKDAIRGFRLELNIDSNGEVGSFVSGEVELGNFTAVFPDKSIALEGPNLPLSDAKYVLEPDLLLQTASGSFYRKIEFVGSECHDICMQDPQCLYAVNPGKDCHLSSGLLPQAIDLANTEFLRSTTTSYWMDDAAKRGSFCTICHCRESDNHIDCSSRNLTILPKTFDETWEPHTLDLRNNPSLVMLGDNTFESIASSLHSIYLPKEMKFISPTAFRGVESVSVKYEDSSQSGLLNVINNQTESFGDVCCSQQHDRVGPGQLSFCQLDVDKPGIDSIYKPFIQYFHLGYLLIREVRPSSDFMSDAASSPEKCAQYCTIDDTCRYFSYDARYKESEHRCFMLASNARSEEICCDADDFSDKEATLPGWTSGWVPRTRHIDGARVVISATKLDAIQSNNYESSYDVSLGSDPLRGAVWIEPRLTSLSQAEVSFSPERVVLYDSSTTITVRVSILSSDDTPLPPETLVINNIITSCDEAFASSINSDEDFVYINILDVENENLIGQMARWVGYALGIVVIVLCAVLSIWVILNRKHKIVSMSQPFFLYMVLFAAVVLSSAIFPLGVDDGVADQRGCNIACMSIPWLVSTGFSLIFAALFSKLWRINRVFKAANSMRRVVITEKDVLVPFVVLMTLNFVILLSWTIIDPLVFQRVYSDDELTSYGRCHSEGDSWKGFISALAILNFVAMILANIQAYLARNIHDELSESKWIGLSTFFMFQISIVGVPLLILVYSNPSAYYFLWTSMIFVVSTTILLLIFIPKVMRWRKPKVEESTANKWSNTTSSANGASTRNDQRTSLSAKLDDLKHIVNEEYQIDITSAISKLQDDSHRINSTHARGA